MSARPSKLELHTQRRRLLSLHRWWRRRRRWTTTTMMSTSMPSRRGRRDTTTQNAKTDPPLTPPDPSHSISKFAILRLMGIIYWFAFFWGAWNQNHGLMGSMGLRHAGVHTMLPLKRRYASSSQSSSSLEVGGFHGSSVDLLVSWNSTIA